MNDDKRETLNDITTILLVIDQIEDDVRRANKIAHFCLRMAREALIDAVDPTALTQTMEEDAERKRKLQVEA